MTTSTLEMRTAPLPVEFRASDTGPGTLSGYAAVFNRLSQNLGGFVEQVDPAAFNKSLADGVRVVARFQHEDAYLLGTTDGGTLALEVDGTGLRYTVDLPDTSAGRDVAALADRGDLRFSSFAFRTLSDDWSVTDLDFPLRTLREVQLIDVAPVVTPAYMDTTAGMRSLSARTGIDDPAAADLAEVRAALTTSTEPEAIPAADPAKGTEDGPGDTHPLLDAARRRLTLAQHEL